jgi:acyl dehydratase
VNVPLSYDAVEIGDQVPARSLPVQRVDLVRYAGASGDFNPIHWNQRFAQSVGLPDVIAHGMFTMAQACRVLTDWAGDPGAIEEYGVRFVRPVVVPDITANDEGPDSSDPEDLNGVVLVGGTVLTVKGVVKEKLAERKIRVELQVTCHGDRVLSAARAVIRLK